MAKKQCTICAHPKRNNIDKSLVEPGATLRTIAQQFQVSKYALHRHVKGGHIAAKIQKAQNARESIEADNLLSRIQKRYTRFEKLAEKSQKLGDDEMELRIYREEARFMELEGKATGAFREKVEISGPSSGPIEIIRSMTDEEIEKRARGILDKRK